MLRPLVAVAVALTAGRAFAAGFERAEQSPEAVATAGAQTADADAAAAVYYDPAALAFQRGLTVQGGATILLYRGTVTPSTGGGDVAGSADFATPTVFVGQRVAARFAVGIGVFDPFAWSIAYAPSWAGRFAGTSVDVRALAINPSLALRPVPWLALGFGVDIVPTTLSYRHATQTTGGESTFAADVSATGVGGNASILVRVLPRWLDAAFAYRSAVDVDVAGSAGKGTLPLPHAFTFAVASRPVAGLTLTTDVRLTLWHDLSALTLTPSDPMAAADSIELRWQNTVGVRVGAAYKFCRDADGAPRLALRLGAGWEQAPTSPAAAHPLFADGDRWLASAGVGARLGVVSFDVGYLVAIAQPYSGASGNFFARYSALTHTLAVALTFRLPDFGYHVDEPAFKR
jgi:long-chain fatty acid transport protein